ncbi:MAG: phosphatidate cytidylyltransferase [Proteobacteria bacterium]|nr:phosphatidate cytidylyltransferase [Pseudomonadota bacterium]
MHLKRWITGLSALPFLIFLVYLGGPPFILLVSIACVCSLWEYYRIVFNADRRMMYNAVTVWGYLISLGILIAAYVAGAESVLVLVALNLIWAGVLSVFIYKTNPAVVEIIQKQVLGVVYIPLSLSLLVTIRHETEGMTWIFLLLAIIFAGDISAYYVGSYLGRHKLSPAISPGKTVEGAIGGLAANLLAGAIGKYLFLPALAWGPALIFFVVAGLAGQAGDLFESEMKRSSKIKDSGGLLPGHGGFLDRLDALLFASPVAYLFIVFIF